MKWSIAFSAAWLFVLVGCGPADEVVPGHRSPAEIELAIPESAIEEEFWEGVAEKRLVWSESGSGQEINLPLTGGEAVPVDFSRGGGLRFLGLSANGAVLVEGESAVAPWTPSPDLRKVILISLRRRG